MYIKFLHNAKLSGWVFKEEETAESFMRVMDHEISTDTLLMDRWKGRKINTLRSKKQVRLRHE